MLLYRIATGLYFAAIRLAALSGNAKAKLWVSGRKNVFADIEKKARELHGCYWFHCASLGEFEQGRPVIEAIKKERPTAKIVLTFFSPSGYEVRKNYAGVDAVFYLPADTATNNKKFINLLKPRAAVFVKYEFWYGYLNELKNQEIPSYLVSGIFRPGQHFFKWYGIGGKKALNCFSHLFVQNDESKNLLAGIGITNVSVCGDTRFDRVLEVKNQAKEIPVISEFVGGNKVFVAGSTWPEDEKIIAELIAKKPLGWTFIIAPHEVNASSKSRLQQLFPQAATYTNPENLEEANVLVLDTIGILSSAYQYATLSYVGGGFNSGIHNVLEAAVYSVPVIFGPNHKRFNEAVDLIEHGAAISVSNAAELQKAFDTLALNEQAGKQAEAYVMHHVGAAERIVNHFKQHGLV